MASNIIIRPRSITPPYHIDIHEIFVIITFCNTDTKIVKQAYANRLE